MRMFLKCLKIFHKLTKILAMLMSGSTFLGKCCDKNEYGVEYSTPLYTGQIS